jgi:hypothetical protein
MTFDRTLAELVDIGAPMLAIAVVNLAIMAAFATGIMRMMVRQRALERELRVRFAAALREAQESGPAA